METTDLLPTTYKAEVNIYEGASSLKISAEETKKISASFDESIIEIRPDGLIYLPQTFWRQRLNETFGIGQWALIPKGSHKDPAPQKDKLYLQGVLMVRGVFVAEAIGEAELHSNNPQQSWASVWESAKSDCITRCCKDLGIASQLWQPVFIKSWVTKHAIQVWREKTGKKKDGTPGSFQWRKKDAEPFYDERKNGAEKPAAPKINGHRVQPPPEPKDRPTLIKMDGKDFTKEFLSVIERLRAGTATVEMVEKYYVLTPAIKQELSQIKSTKTTE